MKIGEVQGVLLINWDRCRAIDHVQYLTSRLFCAADIDAIFTNFHSIARLTFKYIDQGKQKEQLIDAKSSSTMSKQGNILFLSYECTLAI